MRKKSLFGQIVVVLIMIGVAVSVLYPFLWIIVSTFKFERDLFQYPPRLFASRYTTLNYIQVWDRIPLMQFFLNTLIFATVTTLLCLCFDSMAGYAFARLNFKGKGSLFNLILVTMMVPFQVIMIPLFIEIYKFGLLDTYAGLILPRATSAFGIYMMRSFFVSLPKDLEEAARIDGLHEFGIFARIMLPLCKSALLSLGLFHFMFNWNDLIYPLMLTSSANMRTLPAGIAMFIGERVIEYGPTLAATLLSMLPLLLMYLFFQRYFMQSVAITGLKG
jgi:multiple sugar transport system permease protein